MDHARELLARKEAYGIIYIPSDFSRNIGLGGQSHVSVSYTHLDVYKRQLYSSSKKAVYDP